MANLPDRKSPRLPGYDYSRNGAYFITICTEGRRLVFGGSVGADSISARMADQIWRRTLASYPGVECPQYVIMPNHFHGIVVLERADMESAPTLSQVVQTFKRHTTIAYTKLVKAGMAPPFEKRLWQRSFYDHIIRSEADYQRIWQYIHDNPLRWTEDLYYEE